MNEIKESFISYFYDWSPDFSSFFNTTEIKCNFERNFGVDVNQFLSSLTEINSTLSCHIVLILDQVYAGHFSESLNLVLDHLSRGFWAFVDWLEVSDFQLRLLREVSSLMFFLLTVHPLYYLIKALEFHKHFYYY